MQTIWDKEITGLTSNHRSISQKPLQWFKDNRHLFENHDKTSGQTKEQKEPYVSGDYRNYYNLVNHHDQRKMGDIFHRAMFTVFLLRCLQSQGYFPEPAQDQLTEDEVFIGTLLMHFMELLQFNAHEVAQFEQQSKTSHEGAKSVYIGAGKIENKYISFVFKRKKLDLTFSLKFSKTELSFC